MTSFVPTAQPPALGRDDIHVWFLPQWRAEERGARSSVVRSLLAAYLDVDDVTVEYDARGKAHVHNYALQFNVSHSGNALALAISRSQPVGVDLECPRRPRRALELSQRFFDAHEAATLAALPESERQIAFLRLWTAKEAWVKADGSGLASGLHRARFELDVHGGIVGTRDRFWQVVPFEPAPGFYGAVAWRGEPRPVSYLLGAMVR